MEVFSFAWWMAAATGALGWGAYSAGKYLIQRHRHRGERLIRVYEDGSFTLYGFEPHEALLVRGALLQVSPVLGAGGQECEHK